MVRGCQIWGVSECQDGDIPGGLNGSCKSIKCEEGIPSMGRVDLPSIQMRGMVFFFRGVFLS